MESTPTTRNMTCCVCGAGAGRWQQHWNRDDGYGICRACADWISEPGREGRDPLHMARLYGLPGIHYEPRWYRHFGRDFAIVAEYAEGEQGTRDANAFMDAHPSTGLLAATEGRIIIASLADAGNRSTA
ncbi:hypothetical protein HNP48_002265 [Acidovorax soli]|uniref:Uncharacterized protein n=1 Tax=Acidovorax soli TaxID=592050 RepID=A0A7X0PCW7_9BURK|nr:hypothetical protein [Acidovorax soli]MBB6559598.1 hypothetical protein [Acidovorax soli]